MAFANPPPESGPALVTASVEWDDAKNKYVGTVRLQRERWEGTCLPRTDLPANANRPGLAAWVAGPNKETLRVAVAWQKTTTEESGELLLWGRRSRKASRRSRIRASTPR